MNNSQGTLMKALTLLIITSAAAGIVAGGLLTYSEMPSHAPAASGNATPFKNCAQCPEMVAIPAGAFTMGSPPSELYRGAEMQHRVTIPAPFALGKYEVSFAEWDACVADGGCGGYGPDDHGWGRNTRPVVDVSWDDAKAYVAWLATKTGKLYRLPSEAEWEYAARAGAATAFSFGKTITSNDANYDGSTAYGDGAVGPNRQKTVPVGSFSANAFGLHDMHGNVWEWLEDCWSEQYTSATPTDGAPYRNGNCDGRVMRGGSWEDYAGDVRAAARVGSNTDDQSWADGFRVALSMD
jgi:formylglycine-generating enzyme required for sulfatase activity